MWELKQMNTIELDTNDVSFQNMLGAVPVFDEVL